MSNLRTLTLAGLLMGLIAPLSLAQETPPETPPTPEERAAQQKAFLDKIESFGWTREGLGKIGSIAQVTIPKGWRFTDGNGTRSLLELYGNLTGETELGMLTTEGKALGLSLSLKTPVTSKTMKKTSWMPMPCWCLCAKGRRWAMNAAVKWA